MKKKARQKVLLKVNPKAKVVMEVDPVAAQQSQDSPHSETP